MKAVIERRDSRASRWAGRIAYLATVLLLMSGLSHRYGLLETVPFLGVLLIGGVLAMAGLGFALAGFADLWERGDRGGRRALAAFMVCCVLLAPFGLSAWRVVEYPRLTDVATDLDDPPRFLSLAARRPQFANPVEEIDASEARQIRASYADLSGRRYPVSPDQVLDQVLALFAERGWSVVARHGLAEQPAEQPVEQPAGQPDENEGGEAPDEDPDPSTAGAADPPATDESEMPPRDEGAAGDAVIEARAFSQWLRYPSDVVVRLTDEGESTFVDMRSASLFARHDLGDNADRIRRFLVDLDARMEPGGEN